MINDKIVPIQIEPEQIEFNLKDIATLPIYPGTKIPAVKHGYKSAIKNAPISIWLTNSYNLAISLSLSLLICIDVDMHCEDGLSNFKKLVEELGEIDSYTELTPTGGGLHIITLSEGLDDNLKNCDLAEGVEFKINSYIVVAPSVYNGKNYQIIGGINPDKTYKFSKLNDKWIKFINEKAQRIAKRYKKTEGTTSTQDIIIKNRVPSFDKIISRCNFLTNIFKEAATVKEPVWFSAISMLTKNSNTDEFIHYISQGHPNYTREETDKKIKASRLSDKHRGCFYVAINHYEYCKGCPKADEILRRRKNER